MHPIPLRHRRTTSASAQPHRLRPVTRSAPGRGSWPVPPAFIPGIPTDLAQFPRWRCSPGEKSTGGPPGPPFPGSAGMPADRWRLNPSGPGGRPGGSPALDRAGGAMRPIGWPRVTASPLQRCTAQECSAARTGASGGLLGHPRRLGGRSGRGGDARARPGSAGRAWGRQEARRERRRAAGKHRGARRMSSTPRACAVCAGGRPVACRRTSVRTRRRSRTARGCCWGRGRGR